jgi:RNA-directed DNA polymerase
MIDDANELTCATIDHGSTGNSDTGAGLTAVQQILRAFNRTDSLTNIPKTKRGTRAGLMEDICSDANMNRALKQVKRNKGAAGVDGMTIDDLITFWSENSQDIIRQLKAGSYLPKGIKGVKIPKPGGGERQLGIPTAVDRVIQQAIAQALTPIFDPTFSDSSYGFRPKRSAHQALIAAQDYVASGRTYVVDIDLEKFFDRVNHDMLMSKLAKRIDDKVLLKLIRRYLTAGMMNDGIVKQRTEGTPQGSPLSPLLSNIMLDDLDKELTKRSHAFCRYADDCNIYVRSEKAALRVMASLTTFIEKHLKLTVNTSKSKAAKVSKRKFLGYRLTSDGELRVAPDSLQHFKDKVRELTKRNRGRSLELVMKELNQTLRGWANYFKLATNQSLWLRLDAWIRRKLRCYRLKQRKKYGAIVTWLKALGIGDKSARTLASSGKGWWRLSKTPVLHRALSNIWFEDQKLLSLVKIIGKLGKPRIETAVCDIARTVV